MQSVAFQVAPEPIFIETDQQAVELLRLLMNKIEQEPGDIIGFDTETFGRKLPFNIGNSKPLDWMHDTVIFWSLSARIGDEYYRWCLQQQHFQMFAALLENPKAWFTAWNAKYDGHVSFNSGIYIWDAHIVDGLVLARLYDENINDHGLKHCAELWQGLHMTKYTDLFGNRAANGRKIKEFETSLLDLPQDKVSDYASFDAYACLKTVEFLRERLQATAIDLHEHTMWDHFIDTEMPVTKILWKMERLGLPVDIGYFNEKLPVIESEIDKILKDINRIAGRPVNVDAPAQLGKLFFGPKTEGGLGLKAVKMTKGGSKGPQASTDFEVMGALKEAGIELADLIIRARSLNKTRGTYMLNLKNLGEFYEDGRIHPSFNQHGARTGRFSTSVPNSQNFPRPDEDDWGIRSAFIASPGNVLCVCDYEQLEMRIMADRAQDPVMIQAINDGKDLHCFTVAEMDKRYTYDQVKAAKKAKDEKTADELQLFLCQLRQDMKAVGFGIIYGAGPGKLSEKVAISDEEIEKRMMRLGDKELERRAKKLIKKNPLLTTAKAIRLAAKHSITADKIDAYFNVFKRVKEYMQEIPDLCRWNMEHDLFDNEEPKEWGFIQTLVGRYRRLKDIGHLTNWTLRGHAEREAVNTTIQGTAADIVVAAMMRIDRCPTLNSMGVSLLNQIHDELVLEVPEEYAEDALEIVREYMEHPFEGNDALCVPIPISGKICQRWSEGK